MGKTPKIFNYAKKGELKSLKKSVPAKHKVTEEDPETRRTLLHFAAEGGKSVIVEYVLSLPGVQIDARDVQGETPLHVALRLARLSEVHEDVAVLLVRNGADIHADAKKDWKTPAKLVEETNSNRFKIKWKEAVQFVSRQRAISNPAPYDPNALDPEPIVTETTPVVKPPVNVLSAPIPSPPTSTAQSTQAKPAAAVMPAGAMPSLDELLESFSTTTTKASDEDELPAEVPSDTASTVPKDLYSMWHDLGTVISDLVILEANISNLISSRGVEKVDLAIVDLLAEIKNGDLKNEKFTAFQRTKINDAIDAVPERMNKLSECVRLMSFSKADHTDVARVTVPLAGSIYWLYVVIEQITKDDVIKNIGNVAVGAKTAIGEVASGGIPKTMVQIASSLNMALGHKIFESKDPALCLKLSNACHNIAKSVKSLILVPMFASTGAIEGVPILAKSIAEQLQSIKAVNTTLVPSRIGPSLPIEEEEELYSSAYKQLNVALEFYLSNADKVPLPYPNKLVPLIKQQLANMKTMQSKLSTKESKAVKYVTACKQLAATTNSMRNLFLEHKVDFEEDEAHWNNLLMALNGAINFGIQILIACTCIVVKNKICTREHIGFATRGIAFCTTLIIDTFCLDL